MCSCNKKITQVNRMRVNGMTHMAKFVSDRGWTFAGNCNCGANESKWLHAEHPEFRIKTRGNNTMTFEKLINPLNKTDFRAILHCGPSNFDIEFDKLFPEINQTPDATQEEQK
jgi:hypothetical protein